MLSNTRDFATEWFHVTRVENGQVLRGQMLGRSIGFAFGSFARRDDVIVSFNREGVHVRFTEEEREVSYHVGGRHVCAWKTGIEHATLLKIWSQILSNRPVTVKA